MFRLKLQMQHIFNPLHVYCRLTPVLGRQRAMGFTRRYETLYASLLA
jgi:hypothetical protein